MAIVTIQANEHLTLSNPQPVACYVGCPNQLLERLRPRKTTTPRGRGLRLSLPSSCYRYSPSVAGPWLDGFARSTRDRRPRRLSSRCRRHSQAATPERSNVNSGCGCTRSSAGVSEHTNRSGAAGAADRYLSSRRERQASTTLDGLLARRAWWPAIAGARLIRDLPGFIEVDAARL